MKYISLLLMVMALFFVGCGSKTKTHYPHSYFGDYSNQPHIIETSTTRSLENLFDDLKHNSTLSCHISGGCQTAAVGKILGGSTELETESGRKITGIYNCTGFLVDTDIVATNSHCIPAEVKTGRAACSTRLAFQTISENPILCKEVLSFSQLGTNAATDLDYAFFRLEKPITSVTPLSFHTTGVEENSIAKITRMNPLGTYGGSLSEISCPVIRGSILLPSDTSNINSNEVLGDCNIIHGNSGSPTMNTEGKVTGIVKSVLTDDKIRSVVLSRLAPHDPFDKSLAVMTSAACIPFGAHQTLSSDCENTTNNNSSTSERRVANALQNVADNIGHNFASSIGEDSLARWSTHRPSYTSIPGSDFRLLLYPFTPLCLKSKSDWRILQRFRFNRKGHVSETVTLPFYTVEIYLNAFLQFNARIVRHNGFQEFDVTYFNGESQNISNMVSTDERVIHNVAPFCVGPDGAEVL